LSPVLVLLRWSPKRSTHMLRCVLGCAVS
jgi:hypothetical protein